MQVDHIAIRVSDPQYLFSLFTDTLHLPIAWPIAPYGFVLSGAVFAGNANIEIFHSGPPQELPDADSTETQFYAIAFEPNFLTESFRELSKRDIPHSPPIPLWGTRFDGYQGKLWTNVILGGLFEGSSRTFIISRIFGGNSKVSIFVGNLISKVANSRWAKPFVLKAFGERIIFLTEYTHDVSQTRADGLAEFRERQYNTLGVEAVEEIIIGISEYEEKQVRWQNLLSPFRPSAPGLWHLGEGPAIRLVPDTRDTIQALILKVTSLEKAKAFLTEQNMLGTVSDRQVTIAPSKIQGLDIRLVE